MSVYTEDLLTQILTRHREDVAAARLAAQQRVHDDEDARHDCEAPLRDVALPVLREWSKRLAVEGYPTSVEDLLGCRPPSLVFRLTARGSRESSLTLACESGPTVHFKINIEGKDAGNDIRTPLAELRTDGVVQGLGRFVSVALAATIPKRSDCGP